MHELVSRGRFGISLGLERIRRLLGEVDHPERQLRGALVGGTNGKGSVVALVEAVTRAAGRRTGTMPKPHLISYRERICVDGRPVSPEHFAAAIAAILPAVDRVTAEVGPPTEFEALTAAAVLELARRRVELAVIEVGMGGRLDATNALDLGVATITNVQHDHERYLGSTLAAIGAEKAAILKRGNLAVTGAAGRGLRPILERSAEVGVPLRRAGQRQAYAAELRHAGWDGIVVRLERPSGALDDVRLGLLGGHQAGNAAVALATLDALAEDAQRRGTPLVLDEQTIRAGFAAVRWPGRLELLDARRTGIGRVLLDGAHNPAGARALAAALRELGLRAPVLVFGAMRGKRVSDVLRSLAPLDPRPVFTAVDDPGARAPGELLAAWRRLAPGGDPGAPAATPHAALHRAAAMRRGDDPIVVAGSLYLVGAVRALLLGPETVT